MSYFLDTLASLNSYAPRQLCFKLHRAELAALDRHRLALRPSEHPSGIPRVRMLRVFLNHTARAGFSPLPSTLVPLAPAHTCTYSFNVSDDEAAHLAAIMHQLGPNKHNRPKQSAVLRSILSRGLARLRQASSRTRKNAERAAQELQTCEPSRLHHRDVAGPGLDPLDYDQITHEAPYRD